MTEKWVYSSFITKENGCISLLGKTIAQKSFGNPCKFPYAFHIIHCASFHMYFILFIMQVPICLSYYSLCTFSYAFHIIHYVSSHMSFILFKFPYTFHIIHYVQQKQKCHCEYVCRFHINTWLQRRCNGELGVGDIPRDKTSLWSSLHDHISETAV